jgi:hypothetical protein
MVEKLVIPIALTIQISGLASTWGRPKKSMHITIEKIARVVRFKCYHLLVLLCRT